jgi:hypothetical protein
MVSKIRVILALLVCFLPLGLIALGRWGQAGRRDTPEPAGAAMTQEDCRRCHAAVWNEWRASFHSRSFSDPNVQAAFQHFGFDRKCQTCHAPQPVLATGLAEEVELRERDRPSGVNCLSCHGTSNRCDVAARRTVARAACRPVRRNELTMSRMCGTCHEAIYDDWRESRYRGEGKGCRDCHMPRVSGREAGRSHRFPAAHDPAMVRSGVRMTCRREADELIVSVANEATGHNFPGERHNRVLLVLVAEYDVKGDLVHLQQEIIKAVTPFRGESSAEEIRAGETFEAGFPIVEPAVTADVRLLYKWFGWYSDEESLLVHRQHLELEE